MRILHIDKNHPCLIANLENLGHKNTEAFTQSFQEIIALLPKYEGVVIRSRFYIDKTFIDAGTQLKFIARVGSGLENIDVAYAHKKQIKLINAPEGNSNAVAEHCLGLLLSLMQKINVSYQQIKKGKWLREENRGQELSGKTVGIIGYGNTGKAFAQKLKGFSTNTLCYDCKENVGDKNAKQVSLETLQKEAEILSLHIPQTSETIGMINRDFIEKMTHPFWLLNTSRGKIIATDEVVQGLKNGKIIGAGLDVLEYESTSFETIFRKENQSEEFSYLLNNPSVIITPHIAGWTFESHIKLAQTIVKKIKEKF